jgi:hypothetical protein
MRMRLPRVNGGLPRRNAQGAAEQGVVGRVEDVLAHPAVEEIIDV